MLRDLCLNKIDLLLEDLEQGLFLQHVDEITRSVVLFDLSDC